MTDTPQTEQTTPDDRTEPEQVEPEQVEPEQAPEAQQAPKSRPRSDVLGALLDDPQWASIPDLAARAPVAPVPVYTTGNEAYEPCRTITEAEQAAKLQQITVEAWQAQREDAQDAA